MPRCSRWDCDVELFRNVPQSFPRFDLWHPPRRHFLENCASEYPGERSDALLCAFLDENDVLPHLVPTSVYCERCERDVVKDRDTTTPDFFEVEVTRHLERHFELYDPEDYDPDDFRQERIVATEDLLTCTCCGEDLPMAFDNGIGQWVYEECVEILEPTDGSKTIAHRACLERH